MCYSASFGYDFCFLFTFSSLTLLFLYSLFSHWLFFFFSFLLWLRCIFDCFHTTTHWSSSHHHSHLILLMQYTDTIQLCSALCFTNFVPFSKCCITRFYSTPHVPLLYLPDVTHDLHFTTASHRVPNFLFSARIFSLGSRSMMLTTVLAVLLLWVIRYLF